jgi:hypothetical protein
LHKDFDNKKKLYWNFKNIKPFLFSNTAFLVLFFSHADSAEGTCFARAAIRDNAVSVAN